MRFSVIIPVYNVERYLPECVESVLGQTCRDMEVILVDDGSPDGCPALCDNYALADNRVRVIHQKNAGLSEARNAGLDMARGEWVVFIDSDDFLCRADALELLARKADACPEAEIIFHKRIDYHTATRSFSHRGYALPPRSAGETMAHYLESMTRRRAFYNSAASKILRRSLLVDNHIRFTPGLLSEDNDWFYEVMTHAAFYEALDEEIYAYRRQREGSITGSIKEKNLTDFLWILAKWTARTNGRDDWRSRLIRLNLREQTANMLMVASVLKPEIWLKHADEMRRISSEMASFPMGGV